MAWVDLVLLGIVGVSCFIGIMRGLIKEALSLVSWVAALVIAGIYGDVFTQILANLIQSESIRRLVAYAVLFIATMMVGTLINYLIGRLIKISGLKGLDRVLGSLFGLLRGAVIVLVLLFVSLPFMVNETWWQESMLIPYALVAVEESKSLVMGITSGILS